MVQSKHGELSSIPQHPWEKADVVGDTYKPNPGEAEAEGVLGIAGQPS